MTTDHDPKPLAGQLDVYEALAIAETDGLGNQVEQADQDDRPLTAAEVVAKRLSKETGS